MEYSLWGHKELDMTEYLDSYECSPELSVYHLPLMATGTTAAYYLTPVRMTLLKKSTKAGETGEKREPSYTVGGNVNWCSHYGTQYGGPQRN